MLTGKMVRVRHARNRLVPQYLSTQSAELLGVAEELLLAFRDATGRTRGELAEQTADLLGDGPEQLIHQGLAKLLEDRCEFDVTANLAPDVCREVAFRLAALDHAAAAAAGRPFNRDGVLMLAAQELNTDPAELDRALFADLKDEERILGFKDLTPRQLLERYNVALAQAILLRAVRLEVRVWAETPARLRQLFRAVKFHQLLATIRPAAGESYTLSLDGPLSLFSATQRYGKQLALFLPTLLHCKAFELRAEVRWGTDRKDKIFTLASTDGLVSPVPDFGARVPRELTVFAANFRETVSAWELSDDPAPLSVGGVTWVPDFTLQHTRSGQTVYLDVLGFWRKVDLEAHYQRLVKALPGQFVLVVGEAYKVDDETAEKLGPEVYQFKRTPVAAEVAKVATAVAGV